MIWKLCTGFLQIGPLLRHSYLSSSLKSNLSARLKFPPHIVSVFFASHFFTLERLLEDVSCLNSKLQVYSFSISMMATPFFSVRHRSVEDADPCDNHSPHCFELLRMGNQLPSGLVDLYEITSGAL